MNVPAADGSKDERLALILQAGMEKVFGIRSA
jgi:hypothetical protein